MSCRVFGHLIRLHSMAPAKKCIFSWVFIGLTSWGSASRSISFDSWFSFRFLFMSQEPSCTVRFWYWFCNSSDNCSISKLQSNSHPSRQNNEKPSIVLSSYMSCSYAYAINHWPPAPECQTEISPLRSMPVLTGSIVERIRILLVSWQISLQTTCRWSVVGGILIFVNTHG